MSNLLKDASILLTPTAYDNGRMLSIKPSKDLYGPELITNGDFSDGSNDWVIESTWTVANELASGNGANGGGQEIKQTNVLTVGKNYKITYEVKNWVSGSVRENHGAYYSQDGVYTEYITATRHQVIFRGDDFIGDITNVGVKEDLSGDMYFSRNSAATRVNAQGLVENVQILSSNLVQNGSFSEEGAEEVTNGSFSEQGAELVTNGDFATTIPINTNGSGWKRIVQDGNTVEYANGGVKLTVLGVSTNECKLYAQTVGGSSNILTVGKTYKLTYTVLENNGVSNFTYYIGGSYKTIPNTVGTHNYYFTQASNQLSVFRNNNLNSDITLDNVSVKEVGQDWILDANWSIGDDKAISDGTSGNLYQSGIIVTGKQYKIQATVSDYVSGNVEVSAGAVPRGTMSANGTYTFYQTASSTINFFIISNSFTGSIANISVKEVLQNWSVKDYGAVSASAVITPNTEGVKLEKTVSADWRSSFLVQPFSYTSGSQYKVTFKLKNGNLPSGGGVYVRALYDSSSHGIVNNLTLTNDWVEYTYYYTADSNSLDISFGNVDWQNAGVGQYFYVDDVSVIEITDDTNLPRINYEGFSYQDVLGSELVTNGDFSNGSTDWTAKDGVIVSANSSGLVFDNSGGNGSGGAFQNIGLSDANKYKMTATMQLLTGASNGTFSVFSSSANGTGQSIIYTGSTLVVGGDSVTETFEFSPATGDVSIQFFCDESNATYKISNVSVKEYFGQEVVPDSGCGSWLLENESTNLVPYSSDFSDASWLKENNATLGLNTYLSPSGENNASELNLPNTLSRITYVFNTTGVYTFSVYLRSDTNGTISIRSATGSPSVEQQVSLTSQWQRFVISVTGGNYWQVIKKSSDTLTSIYVWGAQLEQQSYATSYIPTSGATSTRLRDLATGSGNATLINSTEGTLYAEIAALADNNVNDLRWITLNDNSADNLVALYYYKTTNTIGAQLRVGTSQNFRNDDIPIPSKTDFIKIAFKWKQDDVSVYINGTKATGSNSVDVFNSEVLNNINFNGGNSSDPFYGKNKALAVYKEALTDANLRCLTYPPAVATTFNLNFNTIATDFTFTRGSEATFVNAQGLIQSTNEIGSELITNGDFATDSDWIKGTGWSISGGSANGLATLDPIYQLISGFTAGKKYKVSFEITEVTNGFIRVYSYVGASGTFTKVLETTSQIGTYEVIFEFGGTNKNLMFYGSAGGGNFTGSIDNVSVKEYITATNTPRLDYSTGAEAFLLEPQSTNLFLQSEIFTSWNGYQATSNTTTSPSGNSVLFLDFEDARMFPTTRNFPNSTECTSSIYLKANKVADVRFRSVSGQDVLISLTTDWVRYELTATSISTTTNTLLIDARFSQGLGASGLEIALWGGQIEQNSYATSYIPTSGASATRNQELCLDATPVINSEEGTLYAEINTLNQTGTFRQINLSNGNASSRIYISKRADNNLLEFRMENALGSLNFGFNVDTTSDFVKVAFRYGVNNFAVFINGVNKNVSPIGSTFALGTLNDLQFSSPLNQPFFGNTKGLKYYPKALADVQLEDLTTI